MLARVLAIPDLHEPWGHPRALDFIRRVQDKFKIDRVINLGDETDQHSFSVKFTADPDLPSPGDELKRAIEELQKWYLEWPHMDVCESNHGTRILKKALHVGLPRAALRAYKDIIKAPEGWNWFEEIIIDNVLYTHGESFSQSSWMTAYNRMRQSVVIGHLHSRAGVAYSQNRRGRLFAANSGCLISPDELPFQYAKHNTERVTLGCTVVIDGEECIFVPMNERGSFSLV